MPAAAELADDNAADLWWREFQSAYPAKGMTNPGRIQRAFLAALGRLSGDETGQTVVEAAKLYNASQAGTEPVAASTWLRNDRWREDPALWGQARVEADPDEERMRLREAALMRDVQPAVYRALVALLEPDLSAWPKDKQRRRSFQLAEFAGEFVEAEVARLHCGERLPLVHALKTGRLADYLSEQLEGSERLADYLSEQLESGETDG